MNGEIFVWDTNEESKTPVIQKSEPDEYYHREAINEIEWLRIEHANNSVSYFLITISTDGKVLMWYNPERTLKFPVKGHMLVQTKSYGGDLESHSFLGGSSLNLVKGVYGQNESTLLIGTYGGQVQRVALKHPTAENATGQDAFRGGMIQWSAQAQFVL